MLRKLSQKGARSASADLLLDKQKIPASVQMHSMRPTCFSTNALNVTNLGWKGFLHIFLHSSQEKWLQDFVKTGKPIVFLFLGWMHVFKLLPGIEPRQGKTNKKVQYNVSVVKSRANVWDLCIPLDFSMRHVMYLCLAKAKLVETVTELLPWEPEVSKRRATKCDKWSAKQWRERK